GLGGGDRSADDVVARLDAIDAALGEIEGLDPGKALERGARDPAGRPDSTAGPGGGPDRKADPDPGSAPPPATGAGSNTATSWTEQVPWPGQQRGGRQGS